MGNDEERRSMVEKLQQTYATKNFYMDHTQEDTPTKVTTRGQHMKKVHGDRCSKKSS
jgi:Tfp pilus assembly major pilin PilA